MTTINGVPRELLERVANNFSPRTDLQAHDILQLRALLAEQPQAVAGQSDVRSASEWFALVMNAAAELEDAANCLRDAEAKKKAMGAASYYRAQASSDHQTPARHDQGDEVRRLREALASKVPLYEAVERACGELPEGWAITLQMENGAGWVELYDAEGIQVEDFPTNNERLDYTLNDAIDAALTHSQQGAKE